MTVDAIGTFGRDEELGLLAAFLNRLPQGAAGLTLEGESGIGKTQLWRAGVAEASRLGYRLVDTRPAQGERALSFIGLGDLFRDAGSEVAQLPL